MFLFNQPFFLVLLQVRLVTRNKILETVIAEQLKQHQENATLSLPFNFKTKSKSEANQLR